MFPVNGHGRPMTHKNRTAHPSCPLSHCMALLGGAWTANILWYLSQGPRRFSELRGDIPLVSAKVLTQRLRALETQGLLSRASPSGTPHAVAYDLTGLGREFLPVLRAIADVGQHLQTLPEASLCPPAAPDQIACRSADNPLD